MGSVTISMDVSCKCCCAGASVESSIAYVSSLTQGCMCGFSEYTSPSTPPKKYLTETLTGTEVDTDYSSLDCTGSVIVTSTRTYSGSCTYSSTDCSTTNTEKMVFTSTRDPTFTTNFTCGGVFIHGNCGTLPENPSATPTVNTLINCSGCNVCTGTTDYRNQNADVKTTLSSENTPAMVLSGATPVAGTDNCAWGVIVDPSGVGCSGGDFTVSEQTCDWTISFTGLVIGCEYTVIITFTSTPGGTSTETHTFTADDTTDTLTGTITQTDGVKTCLTSYTVTAGDP